MTRNESPSEFEDGSTAPRMRFHPNGPHYGQSSAERTVVGAVVMTLLPVGVVFAASFPGIAVLVVLLAVSVTLGQKYLRRRYPTGSEKPDSGTRGRSQPAND